jgi:glycine cleavage system H protein
MNIPKNLKYTEDHEWILVEGNIGKIGISDYAQKELGDIVFVEVETVGQELSQGDTFGTIEAVKTVADMFMPISGEITEKNEKLADHPELINTDPYGDGWVIKVKISNPADLDKLLSAVDYENKIKA